jgi:hypothetical protein
MATAHSFFYKDRQVSGDVAGVAVPDSLQPADGIAAGKARFDLFKRNGTETIRPP